MASGVWERIKQWFSPPGPTSEVGPKGERRVEYLASPWVRFYQRKNQWTDLDMMDKQEAPVARGLDFLARFATTFVDGEEGVGFRLEGPDDELKVLNPLVSLLQADSFELCRYPLKFGDAFAENVVDENGFIQRVKLFPRSYEIAKNVDEFGRLMTGSPRQAMRERKPGVAAYDQCDDYGILLAAFDPYQIIHFSFGTRQGEQYTEPHLGPAISLCKRIRHTMDQMSISRMDGTQAPEVHGIPVPIGASQKEVAAKIKEYRAQMGSDTRVPYDTGTTEFRISAQSTPPSADRRIYIPLLYNPHDGRTIAGTVTRLAADNPYLENLEDVMLLVRWLLCAIGVPADFLNLSVGQRAFIDKTTPEKREAFLYLCCALQQSFVRGIRSILDLQLLLQGQNPLKAQYRVIMPRINPREAEVAANINLKRAQTALYWQQLGIPAELTGERVLKMTPQQVAIWVQSAGEVAPEGKDPDKVQKDWIEYARRQFSGDGDGMLALEERIERLENSVETLDTH